MEGSNAADHSGRRFHRKWRGADVLLSLRDNAGVRIRAAYNELIEDRSVPVLAPGRKRHANGYERTVSVFVALGNRWQLEDMKLQRERAVLDLQGQSGASGPIRQLENEIAVIDVGL